MVDEEKKVGEEGKEEGKESAEKTPSMSDTTLYGIRRVDNLPEFEGCGYKYILMWGDTFYPLDEASYKVWKERYGVEGITYDNSISN